MSKKILVTGATGALGTQVVAAAAAAGHRVLACGRAASEGLPVAFRSAAVSYYAIDLLDEGATAALLARLIKEEKRIDAGFLLAGGFAMGDLAHTDSGAVEAQLRINFYTAYHVVVPLFAHMRTQGSGNICLIGARAALDPAAGGFAVGYTLSKSMLLSLGAMLEAEGKADGVATSVLVPSIIDTPANRAAMPEADFRDWVKPEAIAEALLLLIDKKTQSWRENIIKLYHKA